MKDILNGIIISVISSIVMFLLSKIMFLDALKKHNDIRFKVSKLQGNFKDTNNYKNPIIIIEKQFEELKILLEDIDKLIFNNSIFAFFYNYKSIRMYISLLFDYNRNPIMLPKSKKFEEDYRMDLNYVFKKINSMLKYPIRFIILAIIVIILIIILYLCFK